MSCLYILDINPLSVVSFAIIFSHSQGVFSPCLEFICCPKGFKFNQVPLVYFCFYFHYSRKWVIEDLALIMSSTILPMFSSKSFRIWRKGNLLALLMGMQIDTATLEKSTEVP